MKRQWHNVNDKLPEHDPGYGNISLEVIVETRDGSWLWAFCDLTNGCWYRTDGNPIENVKKWRYGRGYEPDTEGIRGDNV